MEGLIIGFGGATIAGLFAVMGIQILASRHNGKVPKEVFDKLEEISTSHATTAAEVKGLCSRVDRLEDWKDKQ